MEMILNEYVIMFVLFGSSCIAGLLFLPKLITHFKKSEMLDQPNWRSSHTLPTPSSGGISFVFTLLMMIPFLAESRQLLGLVIAAFMLMLLGYIDDRLGLKPKLKFLIQFVAAVVVYFSNIRFSQLNGFLGFEEISPIISFILTVIFIIAIINAYNLIDGVDGLAAGISAIATLIFSLVFIVKGDHLFACFSVAFLGSLIAFLRFNFNPAKIFMGDTGSLFVGLVMAVFFIRIFTNHGAGSGAIALSVILFPVIDMVRLFVVRLLNKKSPFSADNNHYHHLLIKSGDSHKRVAFSGYTITIVHLLTGYIISGMYELTISFFSIIVLAFLMYVFIAIKHYNFARQKSKRLIKSMKETTAINILLTEFNEK